MAFVKGTCTGTIYKKIFKKQNSVNNLLRSFPGADVILLLLFQFHIRLSVLLNLMKSVAGLCETAFKL